MGREGPPQNSRASCEHTDPLAGLFRSPENGGRNAYTG
nr:MAG TPA: hypothetical protein [Caudoviricetes sp.]